MRLKIQGGTAHHDEPFLCSTCRLATAVRGAAIREEIVQCGRLSEARNRMTLAVTFCNGYIDRTHPTIGEMEDTAWILRSDPRRHEIGFVKTSRLRPSERYVLSEDSGSSVSSVSRESTRDSLALRGGRKPAIYGRP